MKERKDDFTERRASIAHLSDEALKARFFALTEEVVNPLLTLAYDYTTPAIERSVLLRMGFSSLEAKAITDLLYTHELLSFGAGHAVYVWHKHKGLSIKEAGLDLLKEGNITALKAVMPRD